MTAHSVRISNILAKICSEACQDKSAGAHMFPTDGPLSSRPPRELSAVLMSCIHPDRVNALLVK